MSPSEVDGKKSCQVAFSHRFFCISKRERRDYLQKVLAKQEEEEERHSKSDGDNTAEKKKNGVSSKKRTDSERRVGSSLSRSMIGIPPLALEEDEEPLHKLTRSSDHNHVKSVHHSYILDEKDPAITRKKKKLKRKKQKHDNGTVTVQVKEYTKDFSSFTNEDIINLFALKPSKVISAFFPACTH